MRPDLDDLDDEIRGHLAISIQERIASGETPEAARLAALKEFGNVTLTRDSMRNVWRIWWRDLADDVLQDVRYAIRLLIRSPGFAAVAVVVLTLGVTANATVFGLFKAAFLRPLPGVARANDLAVIIEYAKEGVPSTLTFPDYEYIRDHNASFSNTAATMITPLSVVLGDRGERVWGEIVSASYFQTLGVGTTLGRTVLPSDDQAVGRSPIVVISEGLWRRAFASAPDVVGRTLIVNGQTLTIVGVTSGGFRGSFVGLVMDVFVPVAMQPLIFPPDVLHSRDAGPFTVLARPKSDVPFATAAAQTEVLGAQLAVAFPMDQIPRRAVAIPLWRSPFGAQTYLLPIVALFAAMGMLLLVIVSANLANLVLVRGLTRRGEVAVRRALGASRVRVVRLLLCECLVLAVPSAIAGLLLSRQVAALLAQVGGAASAALAPTELDTSIGWLDVGFVMVLSLASALIFGFIPALRSSRVPLASVIKEEGPQGPRKARMRSALVVSQVAVSMLLLISAALVVRTLAVAREADPGFDPRGVVSVSLDVKPSGYDDARGRDFYERLLETFRQKPGIDSASLASVVPLRLVPGPWRAVAIEGYEPRRDERMTANYTVVDTDYFRTLRIPLVVGREFTRFDTPSSDAVVVVDETMARRFWSSPQAAMGHRVRAGGKWRTIVGVARNLKHATLTERPEAHLYMPFGQNYRSEMTVHVRAANEPTALLDETQTMIRSLDANLPVLDAHTLMDQARVALFGYEMAASMLTVFGAMAIGLAAIGIYGLVSYTVKQSTHEIGVRLALGAQRADVVRQFLTRGLSLGAAGIVAGMGLSFAASRLIASMLYGVSATDVISFAGAALVVLVIVTAASYVPSWRASRTDPLHALRHS